MKDDKHPPSEQAGTPESPATLDSEAQRLGLREVRAWVRDKSPKSRSAAAERTKRSREKAERLGVKQLSVPLPTELHEPIKALAARVRAGEPIPLVWADLAPAESGTREPASAQASTESRTPAPAPVQATLTSPGGWREWLLRWLLPRRLRALIE